MEFFASLDIISRNLQKGLTGAISHIEMMPDNRELKRLMSLNNDKARQSAVLILLFPKENEMSSVLIQRQVYNGVHSGQVSLPGGKYEKTDKSLIETALRETEEEIGVKASQIEIMGKLSPLYIPPSDFIVQPVIGFVTQPPCFYINADEVSTLIAYPVHLLNSATCIERRIFSGANYSINAPCFNIMNHYVWGATAMILNEFRYLTIG